MPSRNQLPQRLEKVSSSMILQRIRPSFAMPMRDSTLPVYLYRSKYDEEKQKQKREIQKKEKEKGGRDVISFWNEW
jgi:hypothetical protein